MIIEKVTFKDFEKIAKENEYFLWHFLMENQNETKLGLWSVFDKKTNSNTNTIELNSLEILLSMTKIPYFESYTKDSMDFLINLGLNAQDLYGLSNVKNRSTFGKTLHYSPIVIGFKRNRMVYNTHRVCYCVEGVVEIIMNLNPKLLSNIE
jgi:hypothetical protein